MDIQAIVAALLVHLTETTAERDVARAQLSATRTELDALQERLAEIEAQVAESDPVQG